MKKIRVTVNTVEEGVELFGPSLYLLNPLRRSSMTGTLTLEERKQSNTYVAPHVTLGMIVLWYRGGNRGQKPSVGFITDIGVRTVDLSLLPNGETRVFTKTGCHHIDDPKAKEISVKESGCWDYTDEKKESMKQPAAFKTVN